MRRPSATILHILWPFAALSLILCGSISCFADEPPPLFQGIQTAAISNDGRLLAFGDTDITLTDTQTGRTLHTLKGCGCLVGQILFSPDNSKVVSWADVCINNGDMWEAKVWDVATGKLLRTMKAPYIGSTQSGRSGIAFLPGGLLAGTTDCDLYVRCWDMETGKLVRLATTSALFLTSDGTALQLLPVTTKSSSPMWQDWYGKTHVVWANMSKDGMEADIVTVQQIPFNHPPYWYHEKWTFYS
jgi:WD40 repeat protein